MAAAVRVLFSCRSLVLKAGGDGDFCAGCFSFCTFTASFLGPFFDSFTSLGASLTGVAGAGRAS